MDYGTVFLVLIILVIMIGLTMYYNDSKKNDDNDNVRNLTDEQQAAVEHIADSEQITSQSLA
jgi:hypothetical protein